MDNNNNIWKSQITSTTPVLSNNNNSTPINNNVPSTLNPNAPSFEPKSFKNPIINNVIDNNNDNNGKKKGQIGGTEAITLSKNDESLSLKAQERNLRFKLLGHKDLVSNQTNTTDNNTSTQDINSIMPTKQFNNSIIGEISPISSPSLTMRSPTIFKNNHNNSVHYYGNIQKIKKDNTTTTTTTTTPNISNGNKHKVGLCLDFCPVKERNNRGSANDINTFERTASGEIIFLKKYKRNVVDDDTSEIPPEDIRPPHILLKVMDYITSNIIDLPNPFSEIQNFIRDRTRSLRQDLTSQHSKDDISINIHERCVRFHIVSHHYLCELPETDFNQFQNREQLNNCLTSLKQFYDDFRSFNGKIHYNEPEFRSYHILNMLENNADLISYLISIPSEIRNHPFIQYAIEVWKAYRSANYSKFFSLSLKGTYLQACILHRYFISVRKLAVDIISRAYKPSKSSLATYPINDFNHLLGFYDNNESMDFVNQTGGKVQMESDQLLFHSDIQLPANITPKTSKLIFLKQEKKLFREVIDIPEQVPTQSYKSIHLTYDSAIIDSKNSIFSNYLNQNNNNDNNNTTQPLLFKPQPVVVSIPLVPLMKESKPTAVVSTNIKPIITNTEITPPSTSIFSNNNNVDIHSIFGQSSTITAIKSKSDSNSIFQSNSSIFSPNLNPTIQTTTNNSSGSLFGSKPIIPATTTTTTTTTISIPSTPSSIFQPSIFQTPSPNQSISSIPSPPSSPYTPIPNTQQSNSLMPPPPSQPTSSISSIFSQNPQQNTTHGSIFGNVAISTPKLVDNSLFKNPSVNQQRVDLITLTPMNVTPPTPQVDSVTLTPMNVNSTPMSPKKVVIFPTDEIKKISQKEEEDKAKQQQQQLQKLQQQLQKLQQKEEEAKLKKQQQKQQQKEKEKEKERILEKERLEKKRKEEEERERIANLPPPKVKKSFQEKQDKVIQSYFFRTWRANYLNYKSQVERIHSISNFNNNITPINNIQKNQFKLNTPLRGNRVNFDEIIHPPRINYLNIDLNNLKPLDIQNLIQNNLVNNDKENLVNLYWKLIISLPSSLPPNNNNENEYQKLFTDIILKKLSNNQQQEYILYKNLKILKRDENSYRNLNSCILKLKENDNIKSKSRGLTGLIFIIQDGKFTVDNQNRLGKLINSIKTMDNNQKVPLLFLVMMDGNNNQGDVENDINSFISEYSLQFSQVISNHKVIVIQDLSEILMYDDPLEEALDYLSKHSPIISSIELRLINNILEQVIQEKFKLIFKDYFIRSKYPQDLESMTFDSKSLTTPQSIIDYYNQIINELSQILANESFEFIQFPIPEFTMSQASLNWNSPKNLALISSSLNKIKLSEFPLELKKLVAVLSMLENDKDRYFPQTSFLVELQSISSSNSSLNIPILLNEWIFKNVQDREDRIYLQCQFEQIFKSYTEQILKHPKSIIPLPWNSIFETIFSYKLSLVPQILLTYYHPNLLNIIPDYTKSKNSKVTLLNLLDLYQHPVIKHSPSQQSHNYQYIHNINNNNESLNNISVIDLKNQNEHKRKFTESNISNQKYETPTKKFGVSQYSPNSSSSSLFNSKLLDQFLNSLNSEKKKCQEISEILSTSSISNINDFRF